MQNEENEEVLHSPVTQSPYQQNIHKTFKLTQRWRKHKSNLSAYDKVIQNMYATEKTHMYYPIIKIKCQLSTKAERS